MENCCICGKSVEEGDSSSVLTQKGCDGIIRVSCAQGDGGINPQVGDKIHQKCRRDLVRPPKTATSLDVGASPAASISRRSITPKFTSKEHCIFCGQTAKYDGKKKGFDVIPVRTKDFQTSITVLCRDRTDEWSQIVLGRLQYAQDLHAADTVYHQSCSVNFRTGKRIPKQYNSDSNDDKGVKKTKQ